MSRALRLGEVGAVASASAASSSSRSRAPRLALPPPSLPAAVAAVAAAAWSARRGLARRAAAPNAPRGLVSAARPNWPFASGAPGGGGGGLDSWSGGTLTPPELAAAAPAAPLAVDGPPLAAEGVTAVEPPALLRGVEPPTLPLALLRGVLPLPPTCGRPLKTIASIAALTGCPPLEPRAVRSPRAPPLAGGWGGALPP